MVSPVEPGQPSVVAFREANHLGNGSKPAVIIGSGEAGELLAEFFAQNTRYGYSVIGFLDENRHDHPSCLGNIRDLPSIACSHALDTVFALRGTSVEHLRWVAMKGAEHGFRVQFVSDPSDGHVGTYAMPRLGPFPMLPLHHMPVSRWQLRMKRALDVAISALGLLITAPLLPLIALLIILDSPGPVFHQSRRVGKAGKPFVCHKLRTMVPGAEAMLEALMPFNERECVIFKISKDPRITRIGKFLRKYSIDELPQLWDVLVGNMSLVGPRPPLVSEHKNYQAEHAGRLAVQPGITGLWQVKARTDPSFDSYICFDLEYIEHWSLALDFQILLQTIPVVLKGNGE